MVDIAKIVDAVADPRIGQEIVEAMLPAICSALREEIAQEVEALQMSFVTSHGRNAVAAAAKAVREGGQA